MPLEEGSQNVRFANSHVVTVNHKTIALQIAAHTPWGPVVLDPELLPVMSGSDSGILLGRMTLGEM